MQILSEKLEFQLGTKVRCIINPARKGMVIAVKLYADGGIQYEVNHLDSEGDIKNGAFFACELEMDED